MSKTVFTGCVAGQTHCDSNCSLAQPCMTAYCTWLNISMIQAFHQALQISASWKCVFEIRCIKETQQDAVHRLAGHYLHKHTCLTMRCCNMESRGHSFMFSSLESTRHEPRVSQAVMKSIIFTLWAQTAATSQVCMGGTVQCSS